MRVVFMGTPKFAARILQGLSVQDDIEIVGVYTNADAVRKRGKNLEPSDVKAEALHLGYDVFTPSSFKDDDVIETLSNLNPDFICVASYGILLPQSVLDIPKYECLNVHGSLLPKWRGAAPIQRAIMAGDEYMGVSIMHMEAGMDTGDYCLQMPFKARDLGFEEIERQMCIDGIDGLVGAMRSIVDGTVQWTSQDVKNVTTAEKLSKNALFINPDMSADQALRYIAASNDAHRTKCIIADKSVCILEAENDFDCVVSGAKSGSVIFKNKCLFLSFVDGAIKIIRIKPDGKNEMDSLSFASGLQNVKDGKLTWRGI